MGKKLIFSQEIPTAHTIFHSISLLSSQYRYSLHLSHNITTGKVTPFIQDTYRMGHSKGSCQEENSCDGSGSSGGDIIGVYCRGGWGGVSGVDGGCCVGGGCCGVGVGGAR